MANVVTIGGKESYLTPSTVYAVANNLVKLNLDSSALDKLSWKKQPLSSQNLSIINPNPTRFSPPVEESRAFLIVLLNKLIRSNTAGIRPVIPQYIAHILNQETFTSDTLDVGSVLGFLDTLYRLNDTTLDKTGVTDGELAALKKLIPVPGLEVGICAILDHSSSALSAVVDCVAALTAEVCRADVSGVYEFIDSGDGLSTKSAAAVAGDFKVLLTGSKLVGRVESNSITSIPQVHGGVRDAVSSLHVEMRSALNSSAVCGGGALISKVSALESSLLMLGRSSVSRVKLVCDSIDDDELRASALEMINSYCPTVASLSVEYGLAANAVEVEDYTSFFHQVYSLLVKVRQVIAWEGAVSLMLLERNASTEKPKGPVAATRVELNEENPHLEKKKEKMNERKKKVVCGKGTGLVKEFLKERIKDGIIEPWTNLEILKEWVRDLSCFFNPKDTKLDEFLKKLKDILESNEYRRLPKLPKGTRDFAKEQMTIRERAFTIIQNVFKKHGATALDTPAFELRETLMGKYGEDSKLIYDLADQGGELCSLRYDLTVPFARYVAMNGITSLKRYQIAKVYRRDNPSKGRYREFYQCDFDIAGQYEVMGPDFEVVKVLTELLDNLKIGDYEIKLNHRKLLDGMLAICGVSSEKFRTICSSIDKLDKQSFDEIKKEMVEEKGLTIEVADRIGNLVKKRGQPLEILYELKQEGSQFLGNEGSISALNELEILFKALDKSKCIHRVVFDLSLARGLDYYTGVIFEAVFKGTTQVGSIAAGGRYDKLIEMFGKKEVPAVGVSLGIERVFTIMEQLVKDENQAVRATETEVLVGILGDEDGLSQAAELVSELWDANIKAEYMVSKRVMKLIDRAKDSGIPWMVIMGEKERNEGVVKLKNINAREEEVVSRNKIVEELKGRLTNISVSSV